MDRGAQYLPMIQDVFRAEGLPLDLAYIPLIESAFKPTAQSQQARPRRVAVHARDRRASTASRPTGSSTSAPIPRSRRRAAADYLKTLYSMFGDWHLALASYNGGPGRVQRAVKRSGHRRLLAPVARASGTCRARPASTCR